MSLINQIFGRWKVIGEFQRNRSKQTRWLCECQCQQKTVRPVLAYMLIGKRSLSCGCLQKEKVKSVNRTHGLSLHKSYKTWKAMLDRCENPLNKTFKYYGERGITVCEKWHNIQSFIEDMGERPKGLSLDRIDNSKGYYRENCRWANCKQQNNNRRNCLILSYNGENKTLTEWAELFNMGTDTLWTRIKKGLSVKRALETPVRLYTKKG